MKIVDKIKEMLARMQGARNKQPRLQEAINLERSDTTEQGQRTMIQDTMKSFKEEIAKQGKQWNPELVNYEANVSHILEEKGIKKEILENPQGKQKIMQIVEKMGINRITKDNFEDVQKSIGELVTKSGEVFYKETTNEPDTSITYGHTNQINHALGMTSNGELKYQTISNSEYHSTNEKNGFPVHYNATKKEAHTYNKNGLEMRLEKSQRSYKQEVNKAIEILKENEYTLQRNRDLTTAYVQVKDQDHQNMVGANVMLNTENAEQLKTSASLDYEQIKTNRDRLGIKGGYIKDDMSIEEKQQIEHWKQENLEGACKTSRAFEKTAIESGLKKEELSMDIE